MRKRLNLEKLKKGVKPQIIFFLLVCGISSDQMTWNFICVRTWVGLQKCIKGNEYIQFHIVIIFFSD